MGENSRKHHYGGNIRLYSIESLSSIRRETMQSDAGSQYPISGAIIRTRKLIEKLLEEQRSLRLSSALSKMMDSMLNFLTVDLAPGSRGSSMVFILEK